MPVSHKSLCLLLIERTHLIQQLEEGAPAVFQVGEPMLNLRRPEGMHIKTDILAFAAVFIALQGPHLVESAPKIIASKGLILVELEPVLVVEVERPKLPERHRKIDLIRRTEPC